MTDKPVVGSSKTVAESLELASIYRRAPEQQRGGYEQHIVDLADEVGRLRAVVWQIKGTAKEYSGDLALEVTRLCVRALVGVAHETNEPLLVAANAVLAHFMPSFGGSREVDDCLVQLAAAVAGRPELKANEGQS